MNTEASTSNTDQEENQKSEPAIQGRVDIPGGNNFQRPNRTPGQPPVSGQASRPAYPGTYGSTPAYNPRANDAENDRKLVIGQGITLVR